MPVTQMTMAIDMTSILTGGENGGAKVFVIELIRGFARMPAMPPHCFDPKKPFDIAQALIDLVLDKSLRRQLIEDGYRQGCLFSDTDRMLSE